MDGTFSLSILFDSFSFGATLLLEGDVESISFGIFANMFVSVSLILVSALLQDACLVNNCVPRRFPLLEKTWDKVGGESCDEDDDLILLVSTNEDRQPLDGCCRRHVDVEYAAMLLKPMHRDGEQSVADAISNASLEHMMRKPLFEISSMVDRCRLMLWIQTLVDVDVC